MDDSPSPEIVQNDLMQRMNNLDHQWRAYANVFPAGFGVSSIAMAHWIDGTPALLWQYEQLRAAAGWLWQKGYPQAVQHLNARLQDLNQARNVYIETYNNTVQHENIRAGIMRGAINYARNEMTAATNRQNVVFQKWLVDMFDINENRCRDCHRGIGIPGGGYCYDCAKRRGWVW